MNRLSGTLLMATGVLDLLYVLAFHVPAFTGILQDGVFGAVELIPAQLDREIAFWHLTFGATILILGALVHWAQSQTATLPNFLGWSLLALGIGGVILVPVSGFWLILPQAVYILLMARRDDRRPRDSTSPRWEATRRADKSAESASKGQHHAE